jgi:hypothetical protein
MISNFTSVFRRELVQQPSSPHGENSEIIPQQKSTGFASQRPFAPKASFAADGTSDLSDGDGGDFVVFDTGYGETQELTFQAES